MTRSPSIRNRLNQHLLSSQNRNKNPYRERLKSPCRETVKIWEALAWTYSGPGLDGGIAANEPSERTGLKLFRNMFAIEDVAQENAVIGDQDYSFKRWSMPADPFWVLLLVAGPPHWFVPRQGSCSLPSSPSFLNLFFSSFNFS